MPHCQNWSAAPVALLVVCRTGTRKTVPWLTLRIWAKRLLHPPRARSWRKHHFSELSIKHKLILLWDQNGIDGIDCFFFFFFFTRACVLVDTEHRRCFIHPLTIPGNRQETSFSYFETRCRVPTQVNPRERLVRACRCIVLCWTSPNGCLF